MQSSLDKVSPLKRWIRERVTLARAKLPLFSKKMAKSLMNLSAGTSYTVTPWSWFMLLSCSYFSQTKRITELSILVDL